MQTRFAAGAAASGGGNGLGCPQRPNAQYVAGDFTYQFADRDHGNPDHDAESFRRSEARPKWRYTCFRPAGRRQAASARSARKASVCG